MRRVNCEKKRILKYGTALDYVLMGIGAVAALVTGVAL